MEEIKLTLEGNDTPELVLILPPKRTGTRMQ